MRKAARSLPEGVSIPFYTRLKAPGQTAHVVVVNRNGTQHVFRVNTGGNLNYDHKGMGSSAKALAKLEVQNILNDATGYDAGAVVDSERYDSDAEKAVLILFHPLFGVDWSKYEGAEETDASAVELADFHKALEQQVREWKGGRINFPIARHSYWPTFREMMHEAVKTQHGSKVKLYRGVFGDYAGEILRGGPLKIRRLTAWSLNRNQALDIAHYGAGSGGGGLRTDYWLVVQVSYPVTNVVGAPVTIPDYTLDPNIYHAFNHEAEVVIEDKRGELPPSFYKIVNKSRKKLSMAERVALRYSGRSV